MNGFYIPYSTAEEIRSLLSQDVVPDMLGFRSLCKKPNEIEDLNMFIEVLNESVKRNMRFRNMNYDVIKSGDRLLLLFRVEIERPSELTKLVKPES